MDHIEKLAYEGNMTGHQYVIAPANGTPNQLFMNLNTGRTPFGLQPMNLSQHFMSSQSSQNTIYSHNSTASVEVDSPSKDGEKKKDGKKRKPTEPNKETSGGKKGISNKKWKPPHVEVLIPYLVELANSGLKVYKTFKPTALKKAAAHVNSIFGENNTHYNVENHLRTLKDKWKLVCEAKKLSGAGWDEASKMITLDSTTCSEYIERHPKYKPYLNTPIQKYEELRIICREDHATGEFRETSYDTDIEKEFPTINVDEDDHEDVSISEGVSVPQLNGAEPLRIFVKPGTISGKSSRPPRKKKKEESQIIVAEKIAGEIGRVGDAIFASKEQSWIEDLADKIFGFRGFDIDDLEVVYNELYKNELEAKAFLAVSKFLQKRRILSTLQRMGRNPIPLNTEGGTSDETLRDTP